MREILACNVIRPLVERITDPDYINQTILWAVSISLMAILVFNIAPIALMLPSVGFIVVQ